MSAHLAKTLSAPPTSTTLPCVALLATGGTIAGVAATPLEQISYQAGVLPVERILESLPGIEGVARIMGVQWDNLPSENITPEHWAILGKKCEDLLHNEDIHGLTLTHGTDTLEETAFYLDLVLPPGKPVVLTGAMRPATSLSADGPINIRDAVAVAACPAACGRGVLLVMNGRILSARTAVKVSTLDVEAFRALESGCLGRVINGEVQFYHGNEHASPLSGACAAQSNRALLPRVDILYACAGMPTDMVTASLKRAQGLVLAGMGNGSMPDWIHQPLHTAIAQGFPVVRTSRTGSGPVTPLAEYPDFLPGGMLSPTKARVLLMLALAATETLTSSIRTKRLQWFFTVGGQL